MGRDNHQYPNSDVTFVGLSIPVKGSSKGFIIVIVIIIIIIILRE